MPKTIWESTEFDEYDRKLMTEQLRLGKADPTDDLFMKNITEDDLQKVDLGLRATLRRLLEKNGWPLNKAGLSLSVSLCV